MKSKAAVSAGLVLALAVGLQGCATPAKVTDSKQNATQAATGQPSLAGKVVETMNAGGYTYVLLEKNGQKSWGAIPTTTVKVGDELQLQPGVEMGPFTSKSLNRTFKQLVFSGGLKTDSAKAASLPAGHPAMPAAQSSALPSGHPAVPASKDAAVPATKDAAAPAAKHAAPSEPFYSGKVVETMNAGAYTYICMEKDGKKRWAAVPATVVKVGDDVEVRPGTEMGTFTSNSLKRTFDDITFSTGVVPKK